MTYTGTQIVRGALREIRILDPIESGASELIDDAITVGSDLLDTWRTKKLTISGVTRNVYSLTANTQSYTIGSGGGFNQDWPTAIEKWSVIPDDTAANPVEHPIGRPYTWDQWQAVRVKSSTGAYPTTMYYDRRYAAGLGNCLFWPIQTGGAVDVVLYTHVPAITSLVAATSYDLRPGFHRALKLNLAVELADRYGKQVTDRLERRAAMALADLKIHNIIPKESPTRQEFLIGTRLRTFNVRTGG